jgi:hypothetical protein
MRHTLERSKTMMHDECCAIYVQRDEDTRKRIELLYHYVNTLPLTKHQRGKLIRLAEEALVSAEGNGFYTGTCDTSTNDLMKTVERFFKKKLADAGISDQVP